jgi:mannose/fructose/N-acetylgalactosamine-specific phosphotransferase system component IID
LSVLASFVLLMQRLFEQGPVSRVLGCVVPIGATVYFVAVCFSRLFAREASTGYPVGVNLVGAMAGGLVEYLSMAAGMRNVWRVVLGVYTAAWVSTAWIRGGRR